MTELRRTSRGLKRTPGFCAACTRARHCASCLWKGGAERELATRAPRAALVVVGRYPLKGHCTGERLLSFRAEVSNTHPAFARLAHEHATALAVSREEAQYASLRCARTVPRWLQSAHILCNVTAPARGFFPSVLAVARRASCRLQPFNTQLAFAWRARE